MSQEVPGCNKAEQCIDCACSDVCMLFKTEKELAGEEIIQSISKEQNIGACYLFRWVVEIDGDDCPTYVWATDAEDAKSQAIQMHAPCYVTDKIKRVYLHKK